MTIPRVSQTNVLSHRLGHVLRQGIAWWLSELTALLPRLSGLTSAGSETALLLDMTRDDATLIVSARGRPAVTLPLLGNSSEARTRIQGLLRRHGLNDAVTVRLDRALVLLTTIDLPAAAGGSLGPIVEHQLERLVPMAPGEVCFAYKIARPSPVGAQSAPAAATLAVTVAIIKRLTLDRALQLTRSAGMTARMVISDPAANNAAGALPFIFWRADRASAARQAHRHFKRFFEVAFLCLVSCAYGIYVMRLDQLREDLRQQVAIIGQDARKAQEVSRATSAASEALDFFESKRRDVAPLPTLDTLTRLVPQDTWADNLVLRGRIGELTGVSPHAADLIARFEASSAFEKPEFKSPITLSPGGKGERFVLTFGIRPSAP